MDNLIKARKERGLTQAQLAARLGVSRSTVAMWESNKAQPDNDMLNKIADLFDVTVDYLLGRQTIKDNRFEGMDVDGMLDFLANNKEGRVLMSIAKDATKEDLEQIVRIVEALRK